MKSYIVNLVDMSGSENPTIVYERFRFEHRDRKGRLIASNGMSRFETLFRKLLRRIQDGFERV